MLARETQERERLYSMKLAAEKAKKEREENERELQRKLQEEKEREEAENRKRDEEAIRKWENEEAERLNSGNVEDENEFLPAFEAERQLIERNELEIQEVKELEFIADSSSERIKDEKSTNSNNQSSSLQKSRATIVSSSSSPHYSTSAIGQQMSKKNSSMPINVIRSTPSSSFKPMNTQSLQSRDWLYLDRKPSYSVSSSMPQAGDKYSRISNVNTNVASSGLQPPVYSSWSEASTVPSLSNVSSNLQSSYNSNSVSYSSPSYPNSSNIGLNQHQQYQYNAPKCAKVGLVHESRNSGQNVSSSAGVIAREGRQQLFAYSPESTFSPQSNLSQINQQPIQNVGALSATQQFSPLYQHHAGDGNSVQSSAFSPLGSPSNRQHQVLSQQLTLNSQQQQFLIHQQQQHQQRQIYSQQQPQNQHFHNWQ